MKPAKRFAGESSVPGMLDLDRAHEQVVLMDEVVAIMFRDQFFEVAAELLQACRIRWAQCFDQLDDRPGRLFEIRAVVRHAERRNHHAIAIECDVPYSLSQALANDVGISPERWRSRAGRWRRRVARNQRKHSAHEQFGWPGGEGNGAAWLQDSQHLTDGDFGPGREHVAELTEHEFEIRILE